MFHIVFCRLQTLSKIGKKNQLKNKIQINGDENGEQKKGSHLDNSLNKKQKRKSIDIEETVKGKKQKIDAFSGTKALQVNDSESPVKDQKEMEDPIKQESAVKKKNLSKRARKRLALKRSTQRFSEAKVLLSVGGKEANELVNKLKTIVAETNEKSELKLSITSAKKLLYFHKYGKYPDNEAAILKSQSKKNKKKLKQQAKAVSSGGEDETKSDEENKGDVQSKKKNKKLKQVVTQSKSDKKAGGGGVTQAKSKKKNKKLNQQVAKKADDDSDYDVETTTTADKVTKKMNDSVNSDDDDEDVDSDDGDDSKMNIESEDDAVMKEAPKKQKPKKINVKQGLEKGGLVQKGQSRYVLFVNNIPYDTTVQDLKEHFSKTCEVVHVRLPLEKGTNKPRGFAYVEFKDEPSYQKGLAFHHTMLKNRRINVQYTQGEKKLGKGNQKIVREKNLKLHAMRKKGILTSDVKDSQKKAARKAKRNHLQPK